jgi:hypothetical protein
MIGIPLLSVNTTCGPELPTGATPRPAAVRGTPVVRRTLAQGGLFSRLASCLDLLIPRKNAYEKKGPVPMERRPGFISPAAP